MKWNGSHEESRKEGWQNQPLICTSGHRPGAPYLGAAPAPGRGAEAQPPSGFKFDFYRLINLRENMKVLSECGISPDPKDSSKEG